jgi:riboflavin synthase
MFSGIVEESAQVASFSRGSRNRLVIKSHLDHSATKIGDSIAIEGVCLTVVGCSDGELEFDLSDETVRRSTLGALYTGTKVNLERSLKLGERVHGHLVFGHVDGIVTLVARRRERNGERFLWRYPVELAHSVVAKASVSIAGVSLTIGEVERDKFSVYVIPHTAAVTTLEHRRPGDMANIELDMLARYVRGCIAAAGVRAEAHGLADLLRQSGW